MRGSVTVSLAGSRTNTLKGTPAFNNALAAARPTRPLAPVSNIIFTPQLSQLDANYASLWATGLSARSRLAEYRTITRSRFDKTIPRTPLLIVP